MYAHIRRHVLPLTAGLALALTAAGTAGAVHRGPWQQATPVTAVNSPAVEGCPIESPDGDQLFIMSTRGAGGDQDIWVASRDDDDDRTSDRLRDGDDDDDDGDESFGAPQELPAPVNSSANDFCPTPLRGNWLLFVSDRTGPDAYGTNACGGGDLYLTRLSPATGLWSAPRNLGCVSEGGPNGPGFEFGPSLVRTGSEAQLYFSSGSLGMGANTQDIYVSNRRADGSFGARSVVAGLSTPDRDDAMPNVRKDGLEMVFTSNRAGGQGAFDIWSSTRASVLDVWETPVNLGTSVNTPAPETRPSMSWDADRLYFGRAGDIFVSTR